MTLEEFYKELRKTKDLLNWSIGDTGLIRGFSKGRNQIRFCPLSAVVYFKEERYISTWEIFSITYELKMGFTDAQNVLIASDNPVEQPEIREQIEKALFGD